MHRVLYGIVIWQGWTLLFTVLLLGAVITLFRGPDGSTQLGLLGQVSGCAQLGLSVCTSPFWLAAWMALRSSRSGGQGRSWSQSAGLGLGLCGVLWAGLVLIDPTSGSGDYGFVFEWTQVAICGAVASVMLLGAVGLGTLFGVQSARAEEARWEELSSE